jgi:hypothetical protein
MIQACPYCTVKGAFVLLIGIAGIIVGMVVLWHGLKLYFDEDRR